jgi:hypothetical protein
MSVLVPSMNVSASTQISVSPLTWSLTLNQNQASSIECVVNNTGTTAVSVEDISPGVDWINVMRDDVPIILEPSAFVNFVATVDPKDGLVVGFTYQGGILITTNVTILQVPVTLYYVLWDSSLRVESSSVELYVPRNWTYPYDLMLHGETENIEIYNVSADRPWLQIGNYPSIVGLFNHEPIRFGVNTTQLQYKHYVANVKVSSSAGTWVIPIRTKVTKVEMINSSEAGYVQLTQGSVHLEPTQWHIFYVDVPDGIVHLSVDVSSSSSYPYASVSVYYPDGTLADSRSFSYDHLSQYLDFQNPTTGMWTVKLAPSSYPADFTLDVYGSESNPFSDFMVSPRIWNLGTLKKGNSVSQSFAINNTGSTSLLINYATTDVTWLELGEFPSINLQPNQQTTFPATASSKIFDAGKREAFIIVRTNQGTLYVSTCMQVGTPIASLSKNGFSTILPTDTDESCQITIRNLGKAPLLFFSFGATKDWIIGPILSANNLQPSESSTLSFTLDTFGLSAGLHRASLWIVSNAGPINCELGLIVARLLEDPLAYDWLPPDIADVNRTPRYPASGESVQISATMKDDTDLSKAWIFRDSGLGWDASPILTDSATIGPFLKNDIVRYFVYALDTCGNAETSKIDWFMVDDYEVYGYVHSQTGSFVEGAYLFISEEATGKVIEATADYHGYYSVHFSDFSNGDPLTARAYYLDMSGMASGAVNVTQGYAQLNITLSIDMTPPTAPVISSSTHLNQESWYSDNDPGFQWTTPYDLSGIAGYSYSIDHLSATVPDEIVDTTSNSKSYADLVDGTWYFHVRAVDNADNWGAAGHYKVNMDTAFPFAHISAPAEGQTVGSSDVTVSWSGSDEVSGIDHYEIKLDSGDWINKGTSTSHAFNGVSDGSHIVYVKVMDKAGNPMDYPRNFAVVTIGAPIPLWLILTIALVVVGVTVIATLVAWRKRRIEERSKNSQ